MATEPPWASGRDHVEALSTSLSAFGKLVRRAIETTTEHKDQDTADLFTEVSRGLDKWLWMVEAHIQVDKWSSSADANTAIGSDEHTFKNWRVTAPWGCYSPLEPQANIPLLGQQKSSGDAEYPRCCKEERWVGATDIDVSIAFSDGESGDGRVSPSRQ